jgi:hypothetical protein
MLLCTIGSKRREGTLRFGAEVAKALTADTTLLGIVSKDANTELLTAALDEIAQELTELDLTVQVRVEAGPAEEIVMAELERRRDPARGPGRRP